MFLNKYALTDKLFYIHFSNVNHLLTFLCKKDNFGKQYLQFALKLAIVPAFQSIIQEVWVASIVLLEVRILIFGLL